jgi:hypothetical protein
MTADERVRQLLRMAGRVADHHAIAEWIAGQEDKRPLLHQENESCPECSSRGYIISCGDEWRCLACFRVVPGPVPLREQPSPGFSAQRRRGPADHGRNAG